MAPGNPEKMQSGRGGSGLRRTGSPALPAPKPRAVVSCPFPLKPNLDSQLLCLRPRPSCGGGRPCLPAWTQQPPWPLSRDDQKRLQTTPSALAAGPPPGRPPSAPAGTPWPPRVWLVSSVATSDTPAPRGCPKPGGGPLPPPASRAPSHHGGPGGPRLSRARRGPRDAHPTPRSPRALWGPSACDTKGRPAGGATTPTHTTFRAMAASRASGAREAEGATRPPRTAAAWHSAPSLPEAAPPAPHTPAPAPPARAVPSPAPAPPRPAPASSTSPPPACPAPHVPPRPDPHSPRRRLHKTQDRSSPAPHFLPHSLKPGPEPLLLALRPRPHPPQPQRPLAAVPLFRACLPCLPEPGPARPPHPCPCPLAAPGHSLARTAALAAAGGWKWRPGEGGSPGLGSEAPLSWLFSPRVRNPRAPPLALLASPVGNPHTGHTLHPRCSHHASSKRATGLSRPCHLPTPSPPFWPAPSSLWQGPLYRDPVQGPVLTPLLGWCWPGGLLGPFGVGRQPPSPVPRPLPPPVVSSAWWLDSGHLISFSGHFSICLAARDPPPPSLACSHTQQHPKCKRQGCRGTPRSGAMGPGCCWGQRAQACR